MRAATRPRDRLSHELVQVGELLSKAPKRDVRASDYGAAAVRRFLARAS